MTRRPWKSAHHTSSPLPSNWRMRQNTDQPAPNTGWKSPHAAISGPPGSAVVVMVVWFAHHRAGGEIDDCADDRPRTVRIGDIDEMQSNQAVARLTQRRPECADAVRPVRELPCQLLVARR